MLSNPIILLSICTLLAAIPVIIWLTIFFRKAGQSKKTIALVFGLGCLTTPALLLLQMYWGQNPNFNFDIEALITENIKNQNLMYLILFIFFGGMEEIIKHYVVSAVDKRTVLIKTIGETIRYSITAALGFAFAENIYYLYAFWEKISVGELAGLYIFRSIFTTCAHMIFSGIFGYFYGIGKFSIYMVEQQQALGKVDRITKKISRLFKIPFGQAYRRKMVFKGLIIAIGMHAAYNYIIMLNQTLFTASFVGLGYLYLRFLLKRKAGYLMLTTDISEKRKTNMAKKDEEVIMDLISMWFNEKRYVDVIHICQRLLERDPDNEIVKLFKAKAMDKMEDGNIYKKTLGSILRSRNELDDEKRNILSRYIEEKEEFNKTKRLIKKQIEKEGKNYIEYKAKTSTKTNTETKKETEDKLTGTGTFRLSNKT